MKKVLITAKNSYIGKAFFEWTSDNYNINFISCRTDSWIDLDFSSYDCILHVAGIAHVSTNPSMESEYYNINRDLTINLARKAKDEGVKQFIFMSSIIVYGDSNINQGVISKHTVPIPSNFYGNSKLQAEEGLKNLESENFRIAILRLPMIYGKDSKGNYPKLAKIAKSLPAFPDFDNQRSMLHIDNLCEFLKLMIENNESGLFFPQNSEYVKTSEMVKNIAKIYNKNIKFFKIFNPLIESMIERSTIVNKVFGSLIYEKQISDYKEDYRVRNFQETILLTELKENKRY